MNIDAFELDNTEYAITPEWQVRERLWRCLFAVRDSCRKSFDEMVAYDKHDFEALKILSKNKCSQVEKILTDNYVLHVYYHFFFCYGI